MNPNIGIYKITSPSGRIYIGQSVNIYSRKVLYKNGHCKGQFRLYNSILKYGWDAHKFEVIHNCDESELDKWEMHYISLYNTFNTDHGLNLRDGSRTRGRQSEETKKKISESHKGMKHSDSTKEKLRIINTGRKIPDEVKLKMSLSSSRAPKSQETKRKMSLAQMGNQKAKGNTNRLGHTNSPETRAKISKALKGRPGKPLSAETKEKLRIINLGKKHSEESKQLMSQRSKGRKMPEHAKRIISQKLIGNKNGLGKIPSEEKRKKISLANSGEKNGMYGVKQSAETIAKRVAKLKGKKRTPEQIEKIKKARLAAGGWVISPEARLKMSLARKAYLKKQKYGTKG